MNKRDHENVGEWTRCYFASVVSWYRCLKKKKMQVSGKPRAVTSTADSLSPVFAPSSRYRVSNEVPVNTPPLPLCGNKLCLISLSYQYRDWTWLPQSNHSTCKHPSSRQLLLFPVWLIISYPTLFYLLFIFISASCVVLFGSASYLYYLYLCVFSL